jgi:hypothetical protein
VVAALVLLQALAQAAAKMYILNQQEVLMLSVVA